MSEDGDDSELNDSFQTSFTAEEPPSFSIIKALGAIEGKAPTELDPLTHTIDPEALDALLLNSPTEDLLEVTFSITGYQITVDNDGTITLDRD